MLTIVNKGWSLTIVNGGLSLRIVNKVSLMIVNETTNFIKTVVFEKQSFWKKDDMQLYRM